MRLFKNLKARILESIITWPEMGKQTAQAKEVYTFHCGPLEIKYCTLVFCLISGLDSIQDKRLLNYLTKMTIDFKWTANLSSVFI